MMVMVHFNNELSALCCQVDQLRLVVECCAAHVQGILLKIDSFHNIQMGTAYRLV